MPGPENVFRYLVADCQPKMIFSMAQRGGREYTGDMATLREEFSWINSIVCIGGSSAGTMSLGNFLKGADTVSSESCEAALQSIDTADPALIVYTSGTTGAPKNSG